MVGTGLDKIQTLPFASSFKWALITSAISSETDLLLLAGMVEDKADSGKEKKGCFTQSKKKVKFECLFQMRVVFFSFRFLNVFDA